MTRADSAALASLPQDKLLAHLRVYRDQIIAQLRCLFLPSVIFLLSFLVFFAYLYRDQINRPLLFLPVTIVIFRSTVRDTGKQVGSANFPNAYNVSYKSVLRYIQ